MAETKTIKENVMRLVKLGKLTLNIGAGRDQKQLDRGMLLLKHIVGIEPVKTTTSKRIPGWDLRPGLPIGCKLTIRGKRAEELAKQLLGAKDNKLPKSAFDESGNVAFGIHEYIDIPGVKYEPKIGITGLQVCMTLERPGFRIKKRKIGKTKVPKNHRITKEDAMKHLKQKYGVDAV